MINIKSVIIYLCVCTPWCTFTYFYHVFIYLLMLGAAYALWHMYGRQRTTFRSQEPPSCRFWSWTQAVILGDRCVYPLSSSLAPDLIFFHPQILEFIFPQKHIFFKVSTMAKLRKATPMKHGCLNRKLYFRAYQWCCSSRKRERFGC